jgi:toxin ParE1/3/4
MPRYVISPAARRDIDSILTRTCEQFGESAGLRYEALLAQAIVDVAADPNLPGSHGRSEIAVSARTYHLAHSRNHISAEVGRVRRPRHFLLYRTRSDRRVEIGRVLHDAVDLARHLPDEYQVEPGHGDV